jgi:hypothetical protein
VATNFLLTVSIFTGDCSQLLNKFVISTGAYPDFLPNSSWRRASMRLSVKRDAGTSSAPQNSTGNPGERSGEICGFFAYFHTGSGGN